MTDAADQATQLAAAGRAADGVALLEAASARGDLRAMFERASWHIRGIGGPRDLERGYSAFVEAADAGHVNAVLVVVAMIANGTGTPSDWTAAHRRLARAAAADPVAATHVALLDRMVLSPDGRPQRLPSPAPLASTPRVVRFPALLTPAECAHLAHAANPALAPAVVVDETTGRQVANPIRTSHAATLGPLAEDLVVRAINLRIAAASGTAVAQGEPLTVLRYTPGQEYRLHSDALPPATPNQRTATMLVYLNDGYQGGETVFPDLDLAVRGRPGDALLFDNLRADGRAEPAARHAGRPVTAGVKWLATRWIRQRPVDPWTMGG